MNFERLKQLLVTQMNIEADRVTPRAPLEDLELDSLAAVELTMHLDQQLGLELTDDQILTCATVDDLIHLIDSAQQAAS